MSKPMKSYRQRMIEEQDERNRRAKRIKPRQRDRVQQKAKAVFRCRACERNFHLTWEALKAADGTPKCKVCGCALQLVTACLTKGLLPRVG
jgi:transcription elongation factor Elf1